MVTHETYSRPQGEGIAPLYFSPAEVERSSQSAILKADGLPVEIGRVIKMSKSKKNVVDPDAYLETYGADAVRWFVLSDSPPERDLAWSDAGIDGAARLVQRVWKLADEAADAPDGVMDADDKLRRLLHKTIAAITGDIDKLQFNKAIARLYELVSAIERAPASPARREAIVTLLVLCAPMVPHLAEEGWARLGQPGMIVDAPWPVADPALLVDDTVTIAIQINGKLRDSFEAAKGADKAAIEAEVLGREKVIRALEGKAPKKVIVVPDRLVNLVA
jgi:leucyl-tRNA synthetase